LSKVVPLDRVQDVSTRQSLLGRMSGYGTIEIDAAGPTGTEVLDYVPHPDELRDQIFAVSETLRRTAPVRTPLPAGEEVGQPWAG
jgi:uncharacterized membrane protein YdbT with pleckstrin-like domain